MSHICYEGACAPDPRKFPTVRGLRMHQNRCHSQITEEEKSLGNARALKRQCDAEDEARKRQCLEHEAQLVAEAAARELEPQPVHDNTSIKDVNLTFSRCHYWNVPSILNFNARQEAGAFPRAFGTPCQHQPRLFTLVSDSAYASSGSRG